MQQMGCRTMHAYLLALNEDEAARIQCKRLMTVAISRFFRDRGLWRTVEKEILPRIIEENIDKVRVWSAGCGCGEEVYSLKILWHNADRHFQSLPDLEIWATDMNPVYLDKARAGVYQRSSLKEVPGRLLTRYFVPEAKGRGYEVSELLKQGIVWLNQNLLSDPPGTEFQVIFLRNSLLTYYEEKLKSSAFQMVLNSQAPRGFLIIGAHEKIPLAVKGLLPFGHHPCVFQKEETSSLKQQ